MGNPVGGQPDRMLQLSQHDLIKYALRDSHCLALSVLNFSRLKNPICLQTRIASIHTIDCVQDQSLLQDPNERKTPAPRSGTHLDGQVQKHQVPVTAGNDVFVHDGHTY